MKCLFNLSDGGGREVDESERLNNAGDKPQTYLRVVDNCIDIGKAHSDYDFNETEGETTVPSVDEPNEMEGSSHPPEKDSQPQPPTQRRRQPSRRGKAKITRTHSVKAVVEEAKAIIGEASELELDREVNGKAKDSQNIDEQSQGALVQADSVAGNSRQKRRRPPTSGMTNELEAEDSEGRSESLSLGGGRKKRYIAPAMQVLREKRYNLRGSKVTSTVAATEATSEQAPGHKAEEASHEKHISRDMHADEASSKDEVENVTSTHMIQKSAAGTVIEVHEMSSHIVAGHEPEAVYGEPVDVRESDLIKSLELSEGIGEDGDEVDGIAAAIPATPSNGETGEDEDMDEEDEKKNASLRKKLYSGM